MKMKPEIVLFTNKFKINLHLSFKYLSFIFIVVIFNLALNKKSFASQRFFCWSFQNISSQFPDYSEQKIR